MKIMLDMRTALRIIAAVMNSINRVTMIGYLTRDPEIRQTKNGIPVADIAVALNRTYGADNSEKREETTFVDVVLWDRQAELAEEYLAKGRLVCIEGRLQMDTWNDRESGKKRQKLRVVGENMQFLPAGGGLRKQEQPDTRAPGNHRNGRRRAAA